MKNDAFEQFAALRRCFWTACQLPSSTVLRSTSKPPPFFPQRPLSLLLAALPSLLLAALLVFCLLLCSSCVSSVFLSLP